MSLDEIEALHEVDCLDAHAVEKQDGIATIDVKESRNNTAEVGAIFDNAFHPGYHPKTFDIGLQKFTMCFNKVKLLLVLGKLLCFTLRFDLSNVNKPQNCDQTCLKLQRVKKGVLDVS